MPPHVKPMGLGLALGSVEEPGKELGKALGLGLQTPWQITH